MPKGVYQRFPRPLAVRLWERVDKSGDCWLWTGPCNNKGYGVFGIGHSGKTTTHRLSWELTFGVVPAGLFVLHRCDNPPCCRPEHLFIGTNSDNIKDSVAKGRFRAGFKEKHPACSHGHLLTPENTRFSKTGVRICRACRSLTNKKFKEAHPGYFSRYGAKKPGGDEDGGEE